MLHDEGVHDLNSNEQIHQPISKVSCLEQTDLLDFTLSNLKHFSFFKFIKTFKHLCLKIYFLKFEVLYL